MSSKPSINPADAEQAAALKAAKQAKKKAAAAAAAALAAEKEAKEEELMAAEVLRSGFRRFPRLDLALYPRGRESLASLRLVEIGFNASDARWKGKYYGKKCHVEDLEIVLRRAEAMGVTHALVTSVDVKSTSHNLALCRKWNSSLKASLNDPSLPRLPNVVLRTTVGCHPLHSQGWSNLDFTTSQCEKLRALAADGMSDGTVVAWGECGLDYETSRLTCCGREDQLASFHAQLEIAMTTGLPLFLHDRDTEGVMEAILSKHYDQLRTENGRLRGVVHSFTGTTAEMRSYTEAGLWISLNGASLRSNDLLEMVKEIPREALLLETDSPYCGIRNSHPSAVHVSTTLGGVSKDRYIEGELVKDRNEPCAIIQVLEVVASIWETSPVEIAAIVRRNTEDLFPALFSPLSH